MALTLNAQPNAVGMAKNHMALTLETDNLITTAGTKEEWELSFTTGGADTETITIALPDRTIVMTCSTSPDSSGTQFKEQDLETLDDWIDTYLIEQGLMANYYLNKDFVFTRTSAAAANPAIVQMLAREAGTGSAATVTKSMAGLTVSETNAADDEVQQDNFEIITEVWMESTHGAADYTKVIELSDEPNEDLEVTFRLEDVLRPQLEYDLPAFALAAQAECTKVLKTYYVRYGEKYGSPATVKYLYNGELSTKKALLAGVKDEEFPTNNFYNTYINNTTDKKFLTKQPTTKKINTTQKEYLYIYWSYSSLKLRVNVYYTDGTSDLAQQIISDTVTEGVYVLPAGYTQLDIGNIDNTKTVDYYEVYLTELTTVRTELFTYIVDQQYYPYNKYYLFANSLGGFDTLWCNGEYDAELELDRETVELILPVGYASTDRQLKDINISHRDKLVVNTGHLTIEAAAWLAELLTSEEVYEITDSRFESVNVKGDDKLYSIGNNMEGKELEIRKAFSNRSR